MYRCYWNLHKRCYSIQLRYFTPTGHCRWKVWAYADELIADNVTFDVRALGRARVRREGRKNVHAYLIAEAIQAEKLTLRNGEELLGLAPDTPITPEQQITYNPYRHETFVTVGDGEPVEWAYAVHLTTNKLIRSHRKPIIHAEGVALTSERIVA